MCWFVSRLLHAIPHLQPTLYQLFLAHLDHVGLLIRHVLELQLNLIFTNVFIEIGSNIYNSMSFVIIKKGEIVGLEAFHSSFDDD